MPDEKSVEVKATHGLERAVQIVKNMTNIKLSSYQPFMDEYVAAMFLLILTVFTILGACPRMRNFISIIQYIVVYYNDYPNMMWSKSLNSYSRTGS